MTVAWLFLAVSLWGAWFTWNAFRPIYRFATPAFWSFVAGWLTSELALHHVAWQAVATVAFVWAGALEAWPGWLGLAITLVSWAALWRCWQEGRAAEAAMEQALVDTLGRDYRTRLHPDVRDRFATRLDWPSVVRPFPLRHPDVTRVPNLVYAETTGRPLRLDIYHHRDRPRGCPILLQVHGGAWVMGRKDDQGLPLMLHLAARGWVCAAASYRLSPRATFPDPLIDLKRAIAWLRTHAAEFGGDPDFIVVTGGSAGGHLASLLALTPNQPEYQPGFEAVDTTLRGCVAFYGVYDFTNRHTHYRNPGLARLLERSVMKATLADARDAYEAASPMSRVHPGAPPFLVVHGDRDTLVPVEEARRFVAALRAAGAAPVAYAEIPGAQHAFDLFPSLRTNLVVDGVGWFCAHLWSAELAAREARAEAGHGEVQEEPEHPHVNPAEA